MGLRAKVVCGLVLFFVIFGLRFMCANCQQVVTTDLIAEEDRIQPQIWQQTDSSLSESSIREDLSKSIQQSETQTWPHQNVVHRRRRPGARKRRRRPQGYQTTEQNELSSHWEEHVDSQNLNEEVISTISSTTERRDQNVRYFPKPTGRSVRIREPLAALEKERRLSELRNKQRKEITTTRGNTVRDKSYRIPYSQGRRELDSSTQSSEGPSTDLKDILKNSGGLSLSEILQQKNLSLEDLIKGKQNALLALQTPATSVFTPMEKVMKPARRIPLTYLTSSTTSKSPEALKSFETESTPSEESDISNPINSIDVISTSEKVTPYFDLATVTTTRDNISLRRRPPNLFTPTSRSRSSERGSNTMEMIVRNRKPLIPNHIDKQEIEKEVVYHVGSSTDTAIESHEVRNIPTKFNYRKRLTIRPQFRSTTEQSPVSTADSSSSSGESKSSSSSSKSSNSQESFEGSLKHDGPDSNIIEKFTSFEETKPKDVATLEELFSSSFHNDQTDPSFEPKTSKTDPYEDKFITKNKLDVTESNPSLFTDIELDTTIDDRTDLLELLEDRRSGGRLNKVLEQRNMTLDELIEHRQRGSSQLHLAEMMVQNKTNKAFAFRPQVLDERLDIVTAFDNFPHFNLVNLKSVKPDEIKTDSQGSSYFTSIIDIKPTDEIYKEGRSIKTLPVPSPSTQLQSQDAASFEETSLDFFPQWKTFALPVSYNSQENNYIDQPGAAVISAQVNPTEDVDIIDPVAQIEDEVARAHDLLDLELSGHGFKRSPISIEGTDMPMGVRSAIIASSLIVGSSMVIFLVIFIICRWRQKRRKKLTYTESYNAIKSRLPIISRQCGLKRTSNTNSPVIFPGSKNNKINTMDPNSPEVQEYLFDAMRKPF